MEIEKIKVAESNWNALGKVGIKREEIIKEFFIDDLKLVVSSINYIYENDCKSQTWLFKIYSLNKSLDLWLFNTLFVEWSKKEMLNTLSQFEKYGLSMNI